MGMTIIHFALGFVQMIKMSMNSYLVILELRPRNIQKRSNANANNVFVNGNKKENHVSAEAVLETLISKLKANRAISIRIKIAFRKILKIK